MVNWTIGPIGPIARRFEVKLNDCRSNKLENCETEKIFLAPSAVYSYLAIVEKSYKIVFIFSIYQSFNQSIVRPLFVLPSTTKKILKKNFRFFISFFSKKMIFQKYLRGEKKSKKNGKIFENLSVFLWIFFVC